MSRTVAVTARAIASAVALAGCGLGAGKGTSGVTLTVTRDFGAAPVASVAERQVAGSQTVMRMLERSFRVTTHYGGGFVQSINGLSGSASRRDWFYYVNGVEAAQGAAGTAVHRGDRIWWDLHDWTATDSIPAVVGSFPEPFLHGSGGRRWPTTLACGSDTTTACTRIASELKAIGVPAATQVIGSASGTDSIAVVVGTWKDVRGQLAATLIGNGPASSGIYARLAGADGGTLELLDPQAHVVRTLGPDAGLIAATAQGSAAPTWLITGTDVGGVSAAAAALTPARLHNHFALAVQGGTDLPLPLEAAR
ncbi:MAG: DUF4430 domain-containing protein [Solirubrobacterales bacterium]|nr:DUF4430 domain-containing protein [Solirubrobacterales bacterium]MBV9806684.1 DUF4430 domain-containing protein [Solirubrobacterales bacterium]